MTLTVVNELFVETDDAETFEPNFSASMRGTLTGVPGLHLARLLRPNEAERGYLSALEFTDLDAYQRYLGSDAFRQAHEWPDHAPFSRNRLTTYQELLRL